MIFSGKIYIHVVWKGKYVILIRKLTCITFVMTLYDWNEAIEYWKWEVVIIEIIIEIEKY